MEQLSGKLDTLKDGENDNPAYEDNLLKVEVYFEEFNFEQIVERQKYSVSEQKIWTNQLKGRLYKDLQL